MQIHDEDHTDFINPLMEVGRYYLIVRFAAMILGVVFVILVVLASMLTDLVFRYPVMTAVTVVATLLFLGALGVALMLQERAQEKRWKAAEHDGGKALYIDPSEAFVCSVCASRGGPGEECPKHPGARLDSRDDDNRYAIAQALARQQTRIAVPIVAGISLVPIAALSLVFYVITLPCPWGASFVDKRGGLVGGETWCENSEGLRDGTEVHYDAVGTKIASISWVRGQKHGPEMAWAKDGKTVLLEQSWKEGALHGKSLSYYDKGGLKLDASYLEGQPDGLHLGYWPSGNRRSEAQYEQGTPVGLHSEWYDNGQVAKEASFEGGQPHGKHVSYSKRGEIAKLETFAAGVLDGPYRKLNRKGALLGEGAYAEGEKQGAWTEREEKGVYARGEYDAGEKTGVWRTAHESGHLLREEGFEAGKKEGRASGFHPDGSLAFLGDYVGGEKHGVWVQAHPPIGMGLAGGGLLLGTYVEPGLPRGPEAPKAVGELAGLLDVPEEEVPLVDLPDDQLLGVISEAGRYLEGKKEGRWLRWNAEGDAEEEQGWKAGEKDGVSRRWELGGRCTRDGGHLAGKRSGDWYEELPAPSGSPSIGGLWSHRGVYVEGHKEGRWEATTQGRQVFVAHWEGGLKNGVQTTYDLDGNKTEEGPYVDGAAEGQFKNWRGGVLISSSEFKQGYYHGLHIKYANGEIISRTRWDMGEPAD